MKRLTNLFVFFMLVALVLTGCMPVLHRLSLWLRLPPRQQRRWPPAASPSKSAACTT